MVRARRMGGGSGGGGGSGTVTSVALAMPAIFSVAGSPVTTSGTITVTLATQAANAFLGGPASGAAAAPTFRALVAADYPAMVGDSGAGGTRGAVPAPAAGDATKFLRGDGTWVAVSGSGTVTSVGLSAPADFSVSGSPVTGSGTLAFTWANQSANRVLAGPNSGGAATPTFRALVGDDIPTLAKSKISATGSWAAAEYVTMVGDSGAGGTKGAVPAPAAGDAAAGKFLKADGTWAAPGGGSAAWESTGGQFYAVEGSTSSTIQIGDQFYLKSRESAGSGQVSHKFDTSAAFFSENFPDRAMLGLYDNGTWCGDVSPYRSSVYTNFPGVIIRGGNAGVSGSTAATLFLYNGGENGAILGRLDSAVEGNPINGYSYKFHITSTVGWCTTQLGVSAGLLLSPDVASYANSGDSGLKKSAQSGGNMSLLYDNTETWRDDGTNFRTLAGRRPGSYIAIGDSTNLCTYGGNFKQDTTPGANVGTGEDDLQSFALAGGSLGKTGDRIEIVAFGTTAANGNNKTIKLYFGAQVLFSTGAVAFNGADWMIRATVIRTGAATQIACAGFFGDNTLVTQTSTTTNPTETLSGSVTIKTTGEGTSDNDITSQGLVVDVFPVQ